MEASESEGAARAVQRLTTGPRDAQMRAARTCYDHLAGRLGVAVTDALLARGALERTDGGTGTARGRADRLAAPVRTHPYRLGPAAGTVFDRLGVDLAPLLERPRGSRPLLRFCVDWSEQRHHLAGALGAAVLQRAEDAGWVARRRSGRAVDLTDRGRRVFAETLGAHPVA
jgi:hypothetical protein